MRSVFLVSALIALASARMAYRFSSGWEDVLGEVVETFSCEGRSYGYYADVDNGCKVFHVCVPIANDAGEVVNVDQYSFFCGNQTIFNQESLTCTHDIDAFPCEEAAALYDLVNSEFGVIRVNEQDTSETEGASASEAQAEERVAVEEEEVPQEVAEVAVAPAVEVAEEVPVVPNEEEVLAATS